jgi:hypothetical protein
MWPTFLTCGNVRYNDMSQEDMHKTFAKHLNHTHHASYLSFLYLVLQSEILILDVRFIRRIMYRLMIAISSEAFLKLLIKLYLVLSQVRIVSQVHIPNLPQGVALPQVPVDYLVPVDTIVSLQRPSIVSQPPASLSSHSDSDSDLSDSNSIQPSEETTTVTHTRTQETSVVLKKTKSISGAIKTNLSKKITTKKRKHVESEKVTMLKPGLAVRRKRYHDSEEMVTESFEVEKILGMKLSYVAGSFKGAQMKEYRVKWKNLDDKYSTWELASTLQGVPELLEAFETQGRESRRQRSA